MDYLAALCTGRKIYTLNLKPGDTATVGDAYEDRLSVSGSGLGRSYLVLSCDAGGVRVISKQPMKFGEESTLNRVLSAKEVIYITDKISLAVYEAKITLNSELPLDGFDELHVGRSYNDNDICLKDDTVSRKQAVLRRINARWMLSALRSPSGHDNGTFVNGELVPFDEEVPAENVKIFISGYIFEIRNNRIRFLNIPSDIEFAPDLTDALIPMQDAERKQYRLFTRSPRIRSIPGKAAFEISSPPAIGTKPSISWLTVLMPPVMMVAVMSFVAIMSNNFNMLMYSVPMSMMSLVVSFVNNKNNMKKWLKNNGLAIEKYTEYLAETDKKITEAEGAFISSLSVISPGVTECLAIARNVSRRLWERSPDEDDFLNVRVGTGSMDSIASIKIPPVQMTLEENPFIKQAQEIRDKHTALHGIPVCHSLRNCPITGLTGERPNVIRTAWRIIMDIAVHHSYEDVKIVCVYPEEERKNWEWMRWLPHIWDEKHDKRSLACTENEAVALLQDVSENILVPRTRKLKPGREVIPEKPFYVLIIADKALADKSGVTFLPESPALGFSVIYAYGNMNDIPNVYNSVISCNSHAKILNRRLSSGSGEIPFTPDTISENTSVCVSRLDEFARALAPVQLAVTGGVSKMPSSVSFLQGVGAETIQDLEIMNRWQRAQPYKSLAAPMGLMMNGKTFNFNIIDSSIKNSGGMGPHGMTVGTTGSGKTETLTTLLLSIALSYSPEDVNFALIEFKGASLSTVLHPLPHIAGIITNLDDPSSTIRGLKSVKGEMMRRQRVFAKTEGLDTQDLPTYIKYRKKHPELNLEPMPFLLVVIDEFAEFVKVFPDFQDQVLSIAQTGRSMGVYMILTMQSPEGVIKGNVMSNLKFRICMRTATPADSKGILGTEDAFKLSAPGRTIVQVAGDDSGGGPKPIYEHIQTFYAKAPYRPGAGKKTAPDEIYLVSLNGTKTKPQIYGKTVSAEKEEASQGALVVQSILKTAEDNHLRHATPVWKEPLPKILVLDEFTAGHEAFDRTAKKWEQKNPGLAVTVGLVDDPEKQEQYPFVLDFMRDGHQIIYGEPSSGKTSFLQSVMLSAAMTYTPEQVNFVILDYGSNVLNLFESLPHTIIAPAKDDDKLKKASNFLLGELDTRSRQFGAEGVTNLEAYREAIGKPVPAIIVVVDNIASLNEQSSDMINTINKIAGNGGNLGIYLMISALNNSGGYMYKIASNVKSKHTLQMTEKTDYRTLTGSEIGVYPGKFKGRGFTQGGLEYQAALCIEGSTEAERSRKLKALCAEMAAAWTGKRASLESAEAEAAAPIEAGELASTEGGVQIGMMKGRREPVEFVFSEMNGCVISGVLGGGKSSILGMIAQALDQDPDTTLYVYEQNTVIEKLCPNSKTMHKPSDADKLIAELAGEFDKRTFDGKGRIVFCIDDFYNFYQDISQESADILEAIAERGAGKGIYLYICCSSKGLSVLDSSGTPILKKLLAKGNAIIAGGSIVEYGAFKGMHQAGNLLFGNFEGCMIHKNKVTELRFGQPKGA